jgi:hypothetical protein
VLAIAALGVVLAGGCAGDPARGYSFASTYDQRVESVSVSVFENGTFHPGVESDLTAALVRRIQRDTPWSITGADTAQTTVTGVIRDVQIRRLTQDTEGGITQQAAVRMVIDFEWRSNVTGRVLARRVGLAATESFIPAAGEPLDVGLSAVADEMASAILDAMRSVW